MLEIFDRFLIVDIAIGIIIVIAVLGAVLYSLNEGRNKRASRGS